jgi:hypothetical protein
MISPAGRAMAAAMTAGAMTQQITMVMVCLPEVAESRGPGSGGVLALVAGPLGVEAAFGVHALVGVGAEVVP